MESRECPRVAPPEQLPPTPPATDERRRLEPDASVDEALRLLYSYRRLSRTGDLGPWTEIKLSPPLFNRLRNTITRSFRRFDYEPCKGRLVIRMPTGVHEAFISLLTLDIWGLLRDVAQKEGQAGIFASKISIMSSSDTFLDDDHISGPARMQIKRQPDGQFQHRNAPYPGVVIEVSYSQDGKQLRKLAEDYILGSNGEIKAVIGININYRGSKEATNRGSKEATISLWRARIDEHQVLEAMRVLSYQPFRSTDGLAIGADRCLTLHLTDFAPNEISAGCEPVSLSIPFARLADFLDQAEAMVQLRQLQKNAIASKPRMRKRRQSSSSPDKLDSEDEAKFVDREKAAIERLLRGLRPRTTTTNLQQRNGGRRLRG